MSPAVSVLIATYRAGALLREAIASGIAQTFSDLEIIVSDDASDPAVESLTQSYNDPRVRYRANPTRLGPAGNHWAALRSAKGTWVAILNHDDRWRSDFLDEVVRMACRHSKTVLAFCDHQVIDVEGEVLPHRTAANTAAFGRNLLVAGPQASLPLLVVRQSIPMAMGTLFLRSCIDSADLIDDVGPAYDLWLTYLIAKSNGIAVYVPERLTAWREHPQNLTSLAGHDWIMGSALCWRTMLEDPLFSRFAMLIKRRVAASYLSLALNRLQAGDHMAARSFATAALRSRPLTPKAMIALFLSLVPKSCARWVLSLRRHAVR